LIGADFSSYKKKLVLPLNLINGNFRCKLH